MTKTSDFSDSLRCYFADDETKVVVRRARSIIEMLLIVAILYGAGGITGYWIRDNQAIARRAAMEDAHRQDMQRRDEAYATSLKTMAQALQYATGQVAQAASQIDNIAQTSEAAADTAKKAAVTAQRAVAQSNAAVAKSANVLPEITRDQVQRSVERANANTKRPIK